MKLSAKNEARVFLTDYASYNNGTQFEFGHWVDLNNFESAEELNEYISKHFKAADKKSPLSSPREEIMITDSEGFPSELYSESMNFDILFDYFDRADASYYDLEVIEAFISLGSCKVSSADFFDVLEETYNGEYLSDEDFAEDMAESTGALNSSSDWPHNCIDWTRAARDLMYDYMESNGHYFRLN